MYKTLLSDYNLILQIKPLKKAFAESPSFEAGITPPE